MSPPARDDCERFLDALAGGDAMPPALAEHARGCETCGSLARIQRALDVPAPAQLAMDPALREALAEARPVARRGPLARALPTFTAGALVVATLALHRAATPAAALLLAGSAAGFALLFARGRDGVGSPAALRRAYPVAAALTAAMLAPQGRDLATAARGVAARMTSPGTAIEGVVGLTASRVDSAAAAAATAVIVATLAATAAVLGARNTTPNQPALSGATAGAAAALLGLAAALPAAPGGAAGAALMVAIAAVVTASVGRASLTP